MTQGQVLALHLLEPHAAVFSPLIKSVQISLQSLQQTNTPTQLSVICKFTDSDLNFHIQITNKDVKQD